MLAIESAFQNRVQLDLTPGPLVVTLEVTPLRVHRIRFASQMGMGVCWVKLQHYAVETIDLVD
jgi:hypothetical protein